MTETELEKMLELAKNVSDALYDYNSAKSDLLYAEMELAMAEAEALLAKDPPQITGKNEQIRKGELAVITLPWIQKVIATQIAKFDAEVELEYAKRVFRSYELYYGSKP